MYTLYAFKIPAKASEWIAFNHLGDGTRGELGEKMGALSQATKYKKEDGGKNYYAIFHDGGLVSSTF
jgi:hypothetical protein